MNELILENLRTHNLVRIFFFINSLPEVGLCALHIFVSLWESWWYSYKNSQSLLWQVTLVISKPVSEKEKTHFRPGCFLAPRRKWVG